ncbi:MULTISPECIES: hypothetical protein [Xanthomonas]|uniref:Uncharacterized protein n=2 Tax=Xanthomonas TaxID=338 RepID=A0A7Z7NGB2_XANCH|nr:MULTISPECIES: hypothetical protein [Xanthomonas]ATS40445.1 hypothetical protein XcfCFBP6988P_21850 [Xanthomonas citri pv. phaseoli var. fuscans]ATS44639.1 hypothetical protein XcfCFBP6989P_21425 [Xanthomonas citri pv. phaseoli var. fuscans]ATS48453.1 hypothetical protein XcfCFBP6990P_18720 [Xanthomonas citri pv. phaseoli var. fuscans]ATS53207.1 hypothetical protein XcfCFBP6992P_21900 [Xanthomonas citri pv. phaseoli var. fuscans]ATS55078.1 hypothetical protein XcfCFBP6994P_07780 [Xanthomonas
MLHFIELLLIVVYVNFPLRFWLSVRKFGPSRFNDALRSDAHMLCLDVVAVFFAFAACYWIAYDTLGIAIAGVKDLASWEAQIVAFVLTAASMALAYVNGRQRFLDATRAGMPEAALRWLATRQIIAASEVSAALVQAPRTVRRK